MPKTMECRLTERVFVIVHGEHTPLDEDWQVYLDAIETADAWDAQLVYSLGGNPTTKQRRASIARADAAVKSSVPITAILSDNTALRSIAMFFNWFFPARFRFFLRGDLDEAFEYLNLSDTQRAAVRAAIPEMVASLRRAA